MTSKKESILPGKNTQAKKPGKKTPADPKTKKTNTKKAGPRKPGRPSDFLEKAPKIIQHVMDGNYQIQAAMLAGVGKSTFFDWKAQFPEFSDAIKEAEAMAEAVMVSRVRLHTLGNWQAAAWYLERKFPERWGKVDRLQIDKFEKEVAELSDDELIAELHRSGREGMEPSEE